MSRNLIDRDALLEKAKQEQRFYKDEYDAMESGYLDEEREIVKEAYTTMTDCVSLINNAPIVDAVEVIHGEWIKYEDGTICSNCGFALENWTQGIFYNYCPNCGAKMDGEEFEEPTINPCRGCEDYDGYGGCKSNGGCGRTEMDGKEKDDGQIQQSN